MRSREGGKRGRADETLITVQTPWKVADDNSPRGHGGASWDANMGRQLPWGGGHVPHKKFNPATLAGTKERYNSPCEARFQIRG